jgi:hypothetical protein
MRFTTQVVRLEHQLQNQEATNKRLLQEAAMQSGQSSLAAALQPSQSQLPPGCDTPAASTILRAAALASNQLMAAEVPVEDGQQAHYTTCYSRYTDGMNSSFQGMSAKEVQVRSCHTHTKPASPAASLWRPKEVMKHSAPF